MAVILPPLRDCIRPPLRALFVGINPGIRSSQTGHHFAGASNRFWKLLHGSGLVPEPIGYLDDRRLPAWSFGITNLVPRPTPGIDTLRPAEFGAGEQALRRKIRRAKPQVVVLVGVTLFRALFKRRPGEPVALGLQRERLEGGRVFVLPNPSGRNANYSYEEMLAAFKALRRWLAANRSATRRRPWRAAPRTNGGPIRGRRQAVVVPKARPRRS
jgi:TDG/mug DNA glycosylase family protein